MGKGCISPIYFTDEILQEECNDERQGCCVQCEIYWPRTAYITCCQGEKIGSRSDKQKSMKDASTGYAKLLANIALLTVQTSRR